MKLLSNAKINLYLEVTGKDPSDGYHTLDSLFQEIGWADEIELEEAGQDEIRFVGAEVAGNTTVHKALAAFKAAYGPTPPVRITVKKNIPMGAGLGGGSSNAAFTLMGLGEMFGVPLSELEPLGRKIGSDVPFFFHGGLCRVGGKGEVIQPLNAKLENVHFLIVYPNISVSTAWAYGLLKDLDSGPKLPDLSNISRWDVDFLRKIVYNKFQYFVFDHHGTLSQVYRELDKKLDAVFSFMSGSGSSLVFAYDNEEKARIALEILKSEMMYQVCLCGPVYRGKPPFAAV